MTIPDPRTMEAFTDAYQSLNEAQRQAVDTIEGPVMVIAGPGTGKTQILTLRIANILLQTDVAPENILALTFTESGARAMRERLRRYIGERAYRVSIFTFHGFSNILISQYPEAYTRIIGGRPASDLERIRIITDVLNSGQFVRLRPHGRPDYYVRTLLGTIADLKKEHVKPDNLAEYIHTQETQLEDIEQFHTKGAHKGKQRSEYTKFLEYIDKNRELLAVYRQYEAMLMESGLFDFEDMIVETVRALEENEAIRLSVQETYQYVLADEHQDVNGAQNRILELITEFHDQPNIFVVGDEKQAIFRFQGASLKNFLYFQDRFPKTTVIQLTHNYRSGQHILDAAHTLVAVPDDHDLAPLRIALTALPESVAHVSITSYDDNEHEAAALVEHVLSLRSSEGVAASDIAIIVRTNGEVEQYASVLRRHSLPVVATADTDVFLHPVMQAVLHLMSAVINPTDATIFALMHDSFWGISFTDLARISNARTFATPLMVTVADKELLRAAEIDSVESIIRMVDVINKARMKLITESPLQVLEYLIRESGLLSHVSVSDPVMGGAMIRRVYDEVATMVVEGKTVTFEGIVFAFDDLRRHGLGLSVPFPNDTHEGIQVMTAHKSKGLEFDTVFIPNVTDGRWSAGRNSTTFLLPFNTATQGLDAEADEVRLLYVATTRAKRNLIISYGTRAQNGKEQLPSRMLESLSGLVPNITDTRMPQSDDATAIFLLPTTPPIISIELILSTLMRRGLSATALNNYLKNPWDYLYRNVLQIPEVPTDPLMFGTVVHAVMQAVIEYWTKEKNILTDAEVIRTIQRAVGRLPLSTEGYTRFVDRAINALVPYIHEHAASWPSSIEVERKISVVFQTGVSELPELTLTGKLDRLDYRDDGTLMRVVDYKTGGAKSRNAIEGKTADSDGNYKRQLVFYALLLSLYGDERMYSRDGLLSFVEPNARGVFKDELFTVTDEEIEELKQTIVSFVRAIVSGAAFSDEKVAEDSDYAVFAKRWYQNKIM